MTTRTTDRPRDTDRAAPDLRGTRAVVILVGAAVLLLLVKGAGTRFYWVPVVLGVTYLAAAGASRSCGPLWAPGWVLTVVGLAEAACFHAGRPADSFEFAELTLLAAGTGAVIAVAMSVVRVHVSAMSVGMAVLLTGAFNLAEAKGVRGISGNVWFYAALLAAWGVAELLLASRAKASA